MEPADAIQHLPEHLPRHSHLSEREHQPPVMARASGRRGQAAIPSGRGLEPRPGIPVGQAYERRATGVGDGRGELHEPREQLDTSTPYGRLLADHQPALAVFKTAAFVHSAIPPLQLTIVIMAPP